MVLVFPVSTWENGTFKSPNETCKSRVKHGEHVNTLHLQFLESIRQRNKIPFVIILHGFPFGRKMRQEESSVNFSSLRRVNECGTNHRVRTTILRLSASDSAQSFTFFILIPASNPAPGVGGCRHCVRWPGYYVHSWGGTGVQISLLQTGGTQAGLVLSLLHLFLWGGA